MAQQLQLFSEVNKTVFEEPFVYGYVDNFLPPEIYRALDETFLNPRDSDRHQIFRDGKERLNFVAPPTPDFIPEGSPWAEFIAEIGSEEYRSDIFRWAKAGFLGSRFSSGQYGDFLKNRFDADPSETRFSCEFSSLSECAKLAPHTDAPTKVVSFVYYFPPNGWQSEWGGATEVYEAKKEKHQYNWHNRSVSPKLVTTRFQAEFKPNRVFFFVKNVNSWHGLSAVTSPRSFPRRSFNFSLSLPAVLFEDADVAFGNNEIKRFERRIFFPETVRQRIATFGASRFKKR